VSRDARRGESKGDICFDTGSGTVGKDVTETKGGDGGLSRAGMDNRRVERCWGGAGAVRARLVCAALKAIGVALGRFD
jgi:hypothetical protein